MPLFSAKGMDVITAGIAVSARITKVIPLSVFFFAAEGMVVRTNAYKDFCIFT